MSKFGNNLPFHDIPILKGITKIAKDAINKLKPDIAKLENLIKPNASNINVTNPKESLVNTNSNINLNQQTQISPVVTQAALNQGQPIINKSQTPNLNQQKIEQTPNQLNFQGPKDLPSYAGISNMSLKSWISSYDSKTSPKYEEEIKQLASTLEGIKGFQSRNSEGFNTDSDQQNQGNKRNYLMILSGIFAPLFEEQASIQETEIITNVLNFKKLGSQYNEDTSKEKNFDELRLVPPSPNELQAYGKLDLSKIKCLYQLLALPHQFPECIRLFAGEGPEIDPNNLKQFLEHRLPVIQEQLLGGNSHLNKTIAEFVPLLNSNDFSLIIPLVMLYYPLPLPCWKDNYDFLRGWDRKKKKNKEKKNLIASCEVYYTSNKTGRVLLRFELTEDNQFNFDIQVASGNEKIARALEIGIEEIMFLVNEPPNLSELNILLTKEIYNATDMNEQLSIHSNGPLRIEIVLAVYSSLIVLNKLNQDLEPGGIIDIKELI